MCFSQGLLGKISGCLLLGNALFTAYVMFQHPEYEAYYADSESADSMAKKRGVNWARDNPEVMERGAQRGAEWARDNPEQAMKGAQWAVQQQQQQGGNGSYNI